MNFVREICGLKLCCATELQQQLETVGAFLFPTISSSVIPLQPLVAHDKPLIGELIGSVILVSFGE